MELTFNGRKLEYEPSVSWGELLELLESEHLGEGQIIRNIVLDGEESQDFRSPEMARKPLEELGRIDVVSVDWKSHVRDMVLGAPHHVNQVGLVLADAVAFYGQNLPREGALRLRSALLGIDVLMKLVGTLSALGVVDPNRVETSDGATTDLAARFVSVLEEVVRCQEQDQNEELQQVLQDRLLPELATWGVVFARAGETLGGGASSDSPT